MARNLQLQVLRGTQAQFKTFQSGVDPDSGNAVSPLALGEMFFCTDTCNLFFGTPGIGLGYIQVGDMSQVNDTLVKVLNELRAARVALTQLACDGGKAKPQDFNPDTLASDLEATAGNP